MRVGQRSGGDARLSRGKEAAELQKEVAMRLCLREEFGGCCPGEFLMLTNDGRVRVCDGL